MKKLLLVILFCGALLAISNAVTAQESRIGVGAMINDPTGLSAKVWLNENLAIDGALSFSLAENSSRIYFHTSVLEHRAMDTENFQLYYGLGMRLIWTDVTDDFITGLRIPGGVAYSIEDSKIEPFFELVPTLDFSPSFRFGFAGALGLRLYLN